MSRAGARGVRRARAIAAALVLLATGCSTGQDVPATPGTSAATSPTAAATSGASAAAPAPRPRRIRIAFAGDIHFEGALADRLKDPGTALAPASAPLEAADLAVANLETSVGTGGRPAPGKRFTFSAGPAAFAALAGAGIDIASMANNHALDFGRARLPSTLRAARAAAGGEPPLAVIGVGRDREEALRPALSRVSGTVVATIAATVADRDPTADRTGHWAASARGGGTADALDPAHLLAAVRQADRQAGVVVAYLHWGVQGERCPGRAQQRLAGRLVDAGTDVVVGSHAHLLQGDGRLGRGYVAYGLGNFAWYSPGRAGVLTLTLQPPRAPAGRARVVRSAWWPASIGTDGLPTRVRGRAAAAFAADRESLRTCAGLTR